MRKQSKVHVVYCHPSKKSITNSIKEGYIKGLKENNVEYTLSDLYEMNFNSDISEEEYLRENNNKSCPYAKEVLEEQDKINNADILTFIFPIFWMDAPAKLVGYFSRVFTKGFKYGQKNGFDESMKTLDYTNFLISVGSNYDDLRKDSKIKALETIFVKDRMAGKTLKTSMYFLSETTYEKELEFNNRERYYKKAEKIGRDTI